MARKWFQLVREDGINVTSAAAVSVDFEDVDGLRDAVKVKCQNALTNVDAADLTVFAHRAAYDAKQALEEDSPIRSFGGLKKDALIVQVPQRAEAVSQSVLGLPSIEDLRTGYGLLLTILPHVLTNAPTTISGRNPSFKENLCLFYNCYSRKKKWIRCMMLDITFPRSLVTGSHLFRRSNEYLSFAMMQISNIDDVRNGLLLFKPLEHAFDHFQISFIYNKNDDCFHLKLFDPSIRNTPLVDLMRDPNQKQVLMDAISRTKKPCKFDPQQTFGDVDGSVLTFTSIERPYNRCLNLQARVAHAIAMKKQVIDPSYQFEDFWSEGWSLIDKMSMFQQSIANCGQV